MTNEQVRELGLLHVRDAIARGEVTSEQVVAAAIEQAERFNASHGLFVTFTPEQAMQQAREADAGRAAGRPLGPLHGVPITIKDNIDVAGVRTSAGSKVFVNRVPAHDAHVVQRLKAAGAITLGQTNMHEWAMGGTSNNPHYGAVRNPWLIDRIPGGSSGGAAACVALRIGYAALGTDSAGSVRIPACLCGTVGYKPTHGVVSLSGAIPSTAYHTDHVGPLARSVADAEQMFSVMRGYDSTDTDSSQRQPEPATGMEDLRGLIVGVPETGFWEDVDADVDHVCRGALDLLVKAGAELKTIRLQHWDLLGAARVAGAAEGYLFHEVYLKSQSQDYSEELRYRIMAGQYILATDYIRAARARRLVLDELSDAARGVDVLATPGLPVTAYPTLASSFTPKGRSQPLAGGAMNTSLIRNTQPFNWAGLPAITLPAGLSSEGLPIGFHLAAKAFDDYRLLAIAAQMERLLDFKARPSVLQA